MFLTSAPLLELTNRFQINKETSFRRTYFHSMSILCSSVFYAIRRCWLSPTERDTFPLSPIFPMLYLVRFVYYFCVFFGATNLFSEIVLKAISGSMTKSVWPDWAINWTLGNNYRHLATFYWSHCTKHTKWQAISDCKVNAFKCDFSPICQKCEVGTSDM